MKGAMKKKETYSDLVARVKEELEAGGRYSHNIISLCLREIASRFGKVKANKAVRDLGLRRIGILEEKE